MVAVVNQNSPLWLDLVLSIQLNSFNEQRFIPLLIIFLNFFKKVQTIISFGVSYK